MLIHICPTNCSSPNLSYNRVRNLPTNYSSSEFVNTVRNLSYKLFKSGIFSTTQFRICPTNESSSKFVLQIIQVRNLSYRLLHLRKVNICHELFLRIKCYAYIHSSQLVYFINFTKDFMRALFRTHSCQSYG